MTKRIIFLSALCFCLSLAKAQVSDDSVTPPADTPKTTHWTLGVLGGYDRNYHQIDMSYMKDMKYDKYAQGMTFGVQTAYNPWKWLAIRADVVLIDKNYHMDHVSQRQYQADIITQTTTENRYINVPLMLDLSIGRTVRLHVFGGGYVGYWLSSRRFGTSYSMTYMIYQSGDPYDETVLASNNFDEKVPFNETRDNRLDAGFVYGAGLSVKAWKELTINAEARWYYGVLDIQNDYMRNLNPRYNTTFALQGGIAWSL